MHYSIVGCSGGGMFCESKAEAIQEIQEQNLYTAVIWEHQGDYDSAPILLWHQNVLYEIGTEVQETIPSDQQP